MSNHTKSLVGRQFIASIGEPWDFSSSVGQNRLEGEITKVVISDVGQPRLLCTVSPFVVSGISIDQVIGVNRYIGSQNVHAVLASNEEATMNFIFSPSGRLISQEDIGNFLSGSSPTEFLSGSMKLN